ncbi:helicase-related protein [Gemmobacter lanyuensis]
MQGVHFTPQGDKARLLETYLKKHPGEAAIVFSRTKHGADKLAKVLVGWGFNAGAIHGNRSQNQRERTLAEFREGGLDVLVATDVAARGIDIPTVRHVYNYDMPNVPENYVHRIGRTARAGAEGSAVAFCAPAEMEELMAVEKVLKKAIPVIGGAPGPWISPRPPQAGPRPWPSARRPSWPETRWAKARQRPPAGRQARRPPARCQTGRKTRSFQGQRWLQRPRKTAGGAKPAQGGNRGPARSTSARG